jgi:uncharacterized membrane protein YgaE (UPF0421/DUF939 family)
MLRLFISFFVGLGVGILIINKLFNKNSQEKAQKNNNKENKSKKLKFPPEPEIKIEGDKFLNIMKNMSKLK